MNNERKIFMTENIYEPIEYNYDPYDLCECYEPIFEPPESFIEECREYLLNKLKIYRRTDEHKIGNTTYIVSCECDGKEKLENKVKRIIFDDREEISNDIL